MATPHNSAAKGDIAPTVLFPGDPLRAQYVAEHYFKNPRQVTGVRNVLGFTGTWQGKKVSVMASGMGGPSAGIYAYELYTWYGAERIIRIGTAGGLQPFLKLGDLVLAMSASTDSNYAY
ncbi:MAG: purine-nucleoside phosphorylase, partial [Treponema maltophilum]